MLRLTLFLLFLLPSTSQSVMLPVIQNPRIESCTGPSCTSGVRYASDGTTMNDLLTSTPPTWLTKKTLAFVGIHCGKGNSLTGTPFSQCEWYSAGLGHAPKILTKCELLSTDSWDLTKDSTCVTETNWGVHNGAGPGGECLMLTHDAVYTSASIPTPWGNLDATTVANAGSHFCQKMLPPNITCDIRLPGIIDHGEVGQHAVSEASIHGTVQCGDAPVISVIGGSKITLGSGVTTEIDIVNDRSSVTLTSKLRTENAVASKYNGAVIVVASPY